MKAEAGIIIFFLVVGILSAWFHWYFVGDHRLKLYGARWTIERIEHTNPKIVIGDEIYFDDVSIREVLPDGTLGPKLEWEAYGSNTVDGWTIVEPTPYYPYH